MTYIERYLNGEYEEVWNDLMELGETVYQETLYPDAYAVAKETMRRVRKDIEILIERLLSLNYIFGYDTRLNSAFTNNDMLGFLIMFAWSHQQSPVLLPSHFSDDDWGHIVAEGEVPWLQNMKDGINEIERLIGYVPLSVRAWYEEVGGVNLYGFHPAWDILYRSQISPLLRKERYAGLMSACDPLMVSPLTNRQMKKIHETSVLGQPYSLQFAEDNNFKDFYGGTNPEYVFRLPCASADAPLTKFKTFVGYLRFSLQWGGFPGMATWRAVPEEDLAFLTQGLTPF